MELLSWMPFHKFCFWPISYWVTQLFSYGRFQLLYRCNVQLQRFVVYHFRRLSRQFCLICCLTFSLWSELFADQKRTNELKQWWNSFGLTGSTGQCTSVHPPARPSCCVFTTTARPKNVHVQQQSIQLTFRKTVWNNETRNNVRIENSIS